MKPSIDDKIDYLSFYDRYLERVVKSGETITAKCPLCSGRSTTAFSVDLRTGVWKCHKCDESGNIYTFLTKSQGMSEDDAREAVRKAAGIVELSTRSKDVKRSKITVATYAAEKLLPVDYLKELQLKDGRGGLSITIPYLDEAGIPVVTRKRHPKGASQRFTWVAGARGKIIPYGVWKLRELGTKPIVLVEGESDCHTLWHRGYEAVIGIPGAAMMKAEWVRAYFKDTSEILIHVEPGDGGQKFLAKSAAALAEASYSGKVKAFSTRGAKDPSELHETEAKKGEDDHFKQKWEASLESAQLINPAEYASMRADVITLPGAPISLRMPEGFVVTSGGVKYQIESKGEVGEIVVAPVPILLSRRLKNIDTGEEKIELSFQRDGVWHSITTDRPTVFSTRSIVELSRRGLPITSERAKYVVRYLGALEEANLDTLPLVRSVERMGWVGHRSFLPQLADEIHLAPPEGSEHLANAYHEEGSFDDWRVASAPIRDTQPIARFLLSASFATTLLRDLRQRVFIVHLWGQSRGGKTAALKLALSVWGNPEDLMATFNATSVGMERMAGFYNDLPLAIDERQVVSSGKGGQSMIQQLVYMLGAGKGRVRGAQGGGLQQTSAWRTIALTTGEEPISSSNSHAGVKTRSLEIFGTPFNDEELAASVHRTIDRSFGFAGPEFVRRLLAYRDAGGLPEEDFERMVEHVSELVDDRMSSHVNATALVALADMYVSQWIYGMDGVTAMEEATNMATEILKSVESESSADYTARAHEWIQGWIASNLNSFEHSFGGVEHSPDRDAYGFEENGIVWILPNLLDPALRLAGFVPRRVYADLATRGKIVTGFGEHEGSVRYTHRKMFRCNRVRMIGIKPDFEEGSGPQEPLPEQSGPQEVPWWNRD